MDRDQPLCTQDVYRYYYPELIDSSGLVAIAGYLNPATTHSMVEVYRDDIVTVERDIVEVAYGWNMGVTPEQIANFRNRDYPYDFDATLSGIGAWDALATRNRAASTGGLFQLVRALMTVSPPKRVSRGYSRWRGRCTRKRGTG